MHAKSFQSCPILYDPTDCSLLGSSVHRILQARILEWVAMPSSKDHIHCMIHLKVRILEWVAMPSSKDHIHCMIHLKVISNGHALKKKNA